MKKKFCDKCNKDITKNADYSLDIFDEIEEKEILKLDLCENCKDKILELIVSEEPLPDI